MNCSNKSADILKALCATAILLVSVNACTEVDDRLGSSLLPKNQIMKVKVDTLTGAKTYLYKEDSLVSSRIGYAYLGKESDKTGKNIFGARRNSALLQFLPSSYPSSFSTGTAYNNYGIDPIVDSIYIFLSLSDAHGDTTKMQKFNVYRVKDNGKPEGEILHKDTVYYVNFPIDEYKDDLLFTFEHNGRKDVAAKMIPTPEHGRTFLRSIVQMDFDDYRNDTTFLETYRGLYITPDEDDNVSPADAATYSFDLSSSGLVLYGRCHDTLDVTAIYDTIFSSFSFRDTDDSSSGYTVNWNNLSINMVEFDYTGAELGRLESDTNGFTDTLASSLTQPIMYIQSMSGVTGYLRFTDDMITTLRNLQYENSVEHDILINQAMMYIWLEDGWDTSTLNNSLKRIGSYTNLKTLSGIPDYLYYTEYYYQQNNNSSYTLPYNGYLNRSNGYYQFDITSFVQQLAKGKPGDPNEINPVINLGPDAYGFYNFGQSILQGYDEGRVNDDTYKPIKIRLTYTLIEE